MIETSWRWRRIAVFLTLTVALGLMVGLAIGGADTALNRDIAGSASLIILTVVSVYIGGAAWDDRNKMIHGRDQASPPYSPPPVYPPRQPTPPPPAPAAPPAYADDGEH